MALFDIIVWSVVVGVGLLSVGVIVYFMFNTKGQKVQIRLFQQMANGVKVEMYPNQQLYGSIRREGNVEKFYIPNRFSKLPLEGVDPSYFIPSSSSTPVVYLIKDAEGLFRPMKVSFSDAKTLAMKAEDRDTVNWLTIENERLNQKYDTGNFWSTYGALITIGLLIGAGLVIIFVTGQQVNEIIEENRIYDQTQEDKLITAINILNGENTKQIETSSDAQKPPEGTT